MGLEELVVYCSRIEGELVNLLSCSRRVLMRQAPCEKRFYCWDVITQRGGSSAYYDAGGLVSLFFHAEGVH